MTCTHVHIGDACVYICREELREVRREPEQVRWCFGCRKHLLHDFVVRAPVEPSYYGPTPSLECAGCGRDLTVFPGQPSEWSES